MYAGRRSHRLVVVLIASRTCPFFKCRWICHRSHALLGLKSMSMVDHDRPLVSQDDASPQPPAPGWIEEIGVAMLSWCLHSPCRNTGGTEMADIVAAKSGEDAPWMVQRPVTEVDV